MHVHEHAVTAVQARALITAQMPDLAGLPLRRVGQSGTDNVLYRIGGAFVARFPRLPHAEAQIAVMARWLPTLAKALPVAVPLAERFGVAGNQYPFAWTVLPWLEGSVVQAKTRVPTGLDADLARLLCALQSCPIPPEAPNQTQVNRLVLRLSGLEAQIAQMAGETDPAALLRFLATARTLPGPVEPAVWLHGDLYGLNLLTQRGRLSAVIDWGSVGTGDAAVDLSCAWTLFDTAERHAFRAAVNPTPAVWVRARAYAFAKAVLAIPYYRTSNPAFCAAMRVTLARVMEAD